jgi:hypothetical protein
LIKDILKLSLKHPRYGYRRITILLREDNGLINFKRVYRLWCQEGLKVHTKHIGVPVPTVAIREGRSITTMYGAMTF